MDALTEFTDISELSDYEENYKHSMFAVVTKDEDDEHPAVDLFYGIESIPADAVLFFILPPHNLEMQY